MTSNINVVVTRFKMCDCTTNMDHYIEIDANGSNVGLYVPSVRPHRSRRLQLGLAALDICIVLHLFSGIALFVFVLSRYYEDAAIEKTQVRFNSICFLVLNGIWVLRLMCYYLGGGCVDSMWDEPLASNNSKCASACLGVKLMHICILAFCATLVLLGPYYWTPVGVWLLLFSIILPILGVINLTIVCYYNTPT